MTDRIDTLPGRSGPNKVVAFPARSGRVAPLAPSISNFVPAGLLSCEPRSTREQRLLAQIYQRQQRLHREQIAARDELSARRRSLIRDIMRLSDQQLTSGRRDHARCEQMIRFSLILSDTMVCSHPSTCANLVSVDSNGEQRAVLIRELAMQLACIMELAAACNPDESAYSLAWRSCLQLHADDLHQLIEVSSEDASLEDRYQRHPLISGRFQFRSAQSYLALVNELRERYGF